MTTLLRWPSSDVHTKMSAPAHRKVFMACPGQIRLRGGSHMHAVREAHTRLPAPARKRAFMAYPGHQIRLRAGSYKRAPPGKGTTAEGPFLQYCTYNGNRPLHVCMHAGKHLALCQSLCCVMGSALCS